MLTFFGKKQRYCDGIHRRSFLQVGALGIGGLTLGDLRRAEAAAGTRSSNKAIINIHLSGGPSHQDMFDLKPNAPVEFRGEFVPIKTNVSGIEICEHYPKLATMADKFAIIRALVGSNAGHSNFQTHTGFNQRSLQAVGGRPSIGAVVSKLQGSRGGGAPPFASYNGGQGGYLGASYQPFVPGRRNANLKLNRSLTSDRLADREKLLTSLDRIRRDVDASGQMIAMDDFTRTAIDVVTSGRLADAMDLAKEDPRIRDRYGRSNQTLLVARRLIQVGVRVITLNSSWGGWDTHSNNFKTLKTRNLPTMDQGLSTLLTDLEARGMLDDVSIVVWGEFGRTPRVNKRAGRDHWPRVQSAWLAGGGMRTGQAVGSTTSNADAPNTRPVHFQEILATLYHNVGIDPKTTQLTDPAGRPQYLLEHREPIKELI
ncbi:MAG: DUF1501 domain-containing protein [Planctomycetaceae bacterium]